MVKKYWDSFSSLYDFFINFYFTPLYNTVTKEILSHIKKYDTILEVAVGTGVLTYRLIGQCKSVFAIDISTKMLSKLKEKASDSIRLVNMDTEALGFKDNTFDKIICINGLHIFKDPVSALKEMKRVLKKGGYILSATFCYGDTRAIGFKLFLMLSGWFWISGGFPPHLHQFDICSLRIMFQQAGLSVLSTKLLYQFPPFVYIRAFKF